MVRNRHILFGVRIDDTTMQLIFDGDVDSDTCDASQCIVAGVAADAVTSTGLGGGVILDCSSNNPLPMFGSIDVLAGFNSDVVPATVGY